MATARRSGADEEIDVYGHVLYLPGDRLNSQIILFKEKAKTYAIYEIYWRRAVSRRFRFRFAGEIKRASGQGDGVLHVTGRDVEENEHALKFDDTTGHWLMLDGPASDLTLSDTRTTILRYIREHPRTTPKEITEGTQLSYDTVRKTCARMATDGQLHADAQSRYVDPAAPSSVPGVPPVPAVPIPGLAPELSLSADLQEAR